MSALPEDPAPRRRLLFRCGRRMLFASPGDVIRVSGEGNYSRIHFRDGKTFLVRDSITTLHDRLKPFGLSRVHRSHLVHLHDVVEVRRFSRYTSKIVLSDGASVPLAHTYRRALESLLCSVS